MIHLTPLDKTVAGQELIQIGMNEGILKGIEKGLEKGIEKGRIESKIIGKIHFAQRLMKRKITPEKKLLEKSPKELREILKKLEAELKIV